MSAPRIAPEGTTTKRRRVDMSKRQRNAKRCPGCGGKVVGDCLTCEIRGTKERDKLTAKGLT